MLNQVSKKRVYMVVTSDFLGRNQNEFTSRDLRLPGECIAVRDLAHQAFEVVDSEKARYGTLHVKIALATQEQITEFQRREANLAARKGMQRGIEEAPPSRPPFSEAFYQGGEKAPAKSR
jgi:hypothetical protein